MTYQSTRRWLVAACVLTLVGLGLMVWSLVDPRPGPVMVAMTLGQGLGSSAFAIYLVVVISDLRRKRVLGDRADVAPRVEAWLHEARKDEPEAGKAEPAPAAETPAEKKDTP